jgi:hypothetical protein
MDQAEAAAADILAAVLAQLTEAAEAAVPRAALEAKDYSCSPIRRPSCPGATFSDRKRVAKFDERKGCFGGPFLLEKRHDGNKLRPSPQMGFEVRRRMDGQPA